MLNSTPARSCSALPKPINDDPAAAWPRATPGRNWVVLDVAARHRMVVRTESLRIPNWHDTGSTSPRSVGEVALIWDTISHYLPVLIAPLATNFILIGSVSDRVSVQRGAKRMILLVCVGVSVAGQ